VTDHPAAAEVRRHLRVSAYAVCVHGDAMLLTRIAPGYTAESDGKWTLPGGGLEHGEDPRDCVLRELDEETGLGGEVAELLGVDSLSARFASAQDGQPTDFHGIRILYRVRITGGELRDEFGGSTDAARWVALTDLPALPHVSLVDEAVRLIGEIP
jgi:ADP-ribose pyrophosphatase YjhB (NUDIX family)